MQLKMLYRMYDVDDSKALSHKEFHTVLGAIARENITSLSE